MTKLKEALERLLDAAHPAYVSDNYFQKKLIAARDNAFKALESHRLDVKDHIPEAAQMIEVTLEALEPDAYSNCEGDYWTEHPADIDFVDGLSVGDEYELTVALNAWEEAYRVVKIPDDDSDDYEVERIPNPKHRYVTTDQAEAYAEARVRGALEEAAMILKANAESCNIDTAIMLRANAEAILALMPKENKS